MSKAGLIGLVWILWLCLVHFRLEINCVLVPRRPYFPHPLALCCHYPVSKCPSASIVVTGTLRVKPKADVVVLQCDLVNSSDLV